MVMAMEMPGSVSGVGTAVARRVRVERRSMCFIAVVVGVETASRRGWRVFCRCGLVEVWWEGIWLGRKEVGMWVLCRRHIA